MNGFDLALRGTTLTALCAGALFWRGESVLAVSDLHLGRAGRIARLGGTLIPPYEIADTLTRLDGLLAAMRPRLVICLGDSFDDTAASELDEDTALWIARMMAGRRWVWIAGNHDPLPLSIGGESRGELNFGPLTFRHIADPAASGEVSGHYHPKARVGGQARRCFLADRDRVILPAFGTYTGGLFTDAAALSRLMLPDALAILTGPAALPVPMPR